MKNYQITRILSLILLVIILAGVFWYSKDWLLQDRESFTEMIKSYDVLAPLMMILIIIVEVIIAPFPGGWVPMVSGYIFGSFWGGVYAWIGNVLGASISFFLAFYLGRPFVKKMISPDKLSYFHRWLGQKRGLIFLVYLIPIFPIDLITFALGLSGLKFKHFFPLMAIGLLPHMFFLSFFGHRINQSSLYHIRPLLSPILIFLFCLLIYWQIRKKNKLSQQNHA